MDSNKVAPIWIVVLVKDPSRAKTRLRQALSPVERRALARDCASRALRAARETAPTLAVCGGPEAAELAAAAAVEAVLERRAEGQNPAGERGLRAAARRGAAGALLLSSDLPLVTADGLRRLLDRAAAEHGPLTVAVAATGREGTNALLLRPIGQFDLMFGDRSLPRFAAEAARRGRRFLLHEDPALALDIDEPDDLAALDGLRATAARAARAACLPSSARA
jgi:2-phospho-L-lactate guanylyltransferase